MQETTTVNQLNQALNELLIRRPESALGHTAKKIAISAMDFLLNSQIEELTIEELGLTLSALQDNGIMNKEICEFRRTAEERLSKERDFIPSPIGLYFASLWYSEKLYPLIWAVEAESTSSE